MRYLINHWMLLRRLGDLLVPVVVAAMALLVNIAISCADQHTDAMGTNAGQWDQLSSCSVSPLPVDA